MDIYKKILTFLSQNDNGNFVDISCLSDDILYLKDKSIELKKLGYIEIKSPGVYVLGDLNGNIKTYGNKESLKKIEAKILLLGYNYLKESKEIQRKNENKLTLLLKKYWWLLFIPIIIGVILLYIEYNFFNKNN